MPRKIKTKAKTKANAKTLAAKPPRAKRVQPEPSEASLAQNTSSTSPGHIEAAAAAPNLSEDEDDDEDEEDSDSDSYDEALARVTRKIIEKAKTRLSAARTRRKKKLQQRVSTLKQEILVTYNKRAEERQALRQDVQALALQLQRRAEIEKAIWGELKTLKRGVVAMGREVEVALKGRARDVNVVIEKAVAVKEAGPVSSVVDG